MAKYFDESMLIEQPNETPEQLLARYEQQARAWRHRQDVEPNESAAMFAGDLAHMFEQLTSSLAQTLASLAAVRFAIDVHDRYLDASQHRSPDNFATRTATTLAEIRKAVL